MRVLELAAQLPLAPGGSGGQIRQFHLLRGLAERGHDVAVVAPVTRPEASQTWRLAEAGLRLQGYQRPGPRVSETLAGLRRRPRLVPAALWQPVHAWQLGVLWEHLRPLAMRCIAAERPDVVLVERDAAAGWVADLQSDIPRVLMLHDVTTAYYGSRAATARGMRAPLLRLEAERFGRWIRRWAPQYAGFVVVSEPDALRLRELVPAARVAVIPNGVDVASFPFQEAAAPPPPTVLFTGTMNYPPNAEAITWFHREVWPQITARVRGARLRVVGRNPAGAVQRLAEADNVEVTGAVDDVSPYFAAAHVVVVPLLSGGGTRLKILEAASSGRPVVTTTVGLEGLDLGREVVVADGAGPFADAVVALVSDGARRIALATAARAAVQERYDWSTLAARLDEVLVSWCG